MKKSILAVAALTAFAGVASAQSTATIYGKVDVGLANPMGGTAVVQQASGSRLGFRAIEDLGGGLKATAWIEHRFTPDDGNAAGTFWAGTSVVGLSGGFGTLNFGRTYTAAFYNSLGGDVFGWDGVANNGAVNRAGAQAIRFANGMFYTSPNMGGVTVMASLSKKEGTEVRNGSSLRAVYAAGPVSLDVATERTNAGNSYSGFGASYNMGVAKVNVLLSKGEVGTKEYDGTTFGLVVPMGAMTLKASYAKMDTNGAATTNQLGLGMRYAMSKRTDIYASYARNSKRATDKTGTEIGIQTNF